MKDKLNSTNTLGELITKNKLHLKSKLLKIDKLLIDDFPLLLESTIQKEITIGSYQLRQSLSYLAEHFNTNGKYLIFGNKESQLIGDSKLIHMQFQSRHSNRTKYKTYIKYFPNQNDSNSIQGF